MPLSLNFNTPYLQTTPSFRQGALPGRDQNDRIRDTFGLARGEVEKILTKGLPGADVTILSDSTSCATFSLTCRRDGRTVFEAEDCQFQKGPGILTLASGRGTLVRAQQKGLGLGKIFLSNVLDLAQATGLKTVNMRAGDANGAFFWPRFGAELENGPGSRPYQSFEDTVRDNLKRVPAEIAAAVEQILAAPSHTANVRIANLPGRFDGMPAGAPVLNGTGQMVRFSVDDADKMEFTRQGLGDIDALRSQVSQYFTLSAPHASSALKL